MKSFTEENIWKELMETEGQQQPPSGGGGVIMNTISVLADSYGPAHPIIKQEAQTTAPV